MEKKEVKHMTNEEAINELLQCYSLYSPFKTAKKTNEAISMAIKALEETHTLNGNTLTIKISEENIDNVKRVMLDCAPWCRTFYEDAKDINVPSKSALDHIHNVVRDDAYKRGYEQGKKDAAPTWIPTSERVPSNNDTVLIVHKGGVSTGWWNGRYWERGASSNHRMLKTVTHWMPFPEAPKGE